MTDVRTSYEVHCADGPRRFGWDYARAVGYAKEYREARCEDGQEDGAWFAIVVEVEERPLGRFERDVAGYQGKGCSRPFRSYAVRVMT